MDMAMTDEMGATGALHRGSEDPRTAAELGRVLLETRKRFRLNQVEAATIMGLSGKTYVSRLETGAVPMRVERCIELCLRLILRQHSDRDIERLARGLAASDTDLVNALLRLSLRAEAVKADEVEGIVRAAAASAQN